MALNNNFQREGASSNTQVGIDFEENIKLYFERKGISLRKDVSLDIGINQHKKSHKFDLGNLTEKILIECKSHTWTKSDYVPSAKITTWDQGMYYFLATPTGYRKIFMVLKDYSEKRDETLCEYYLRTKRHLIPNDVELWEFDEPNMKAIRRK